MDTKIVLEDVCKDYGSKRALNQINLTIESGMFGLLRTKWSWKDDNDEDFDFSFAQDKWKDYNVRHTD